MLSLFKRSLIWLIPPCAHFFQWSVCLGMVIYLLYYETLLKCVSLEKLGDITGSGIVLYNPSYCLHLICLLEPSWHHNGMVVCPLLYHNGLLACPLWCHMLQCSVMICWSVLLRTHSAAQFLLRLILILIICIFVLFSPCITPDKVLSQLISSDSGGFVILSLF